MTPNAPTSTILNRGLVVSLAVLMVAAAGCGSSESEPTTATAPVTTAAAATTTATPVATTTTTTTTTIPTTTTTAAPDHEGAHTATFDGSSCVVAGPTELATGEYSFTLVNLSDKDLDLFVIRFSPGKTFQDALDHQEEEGRWKPKPSWLHYTTDFGNTKTDDGEIVDINLDEEGEHAVYVTTYYKVAADERELWNCSPSFNVVEHTS